MKRFYMARVSFDIPVVANDHEGARDVAREFAAEEFRNGSRREIQVWPEGTPPRGMLGSLPWGADDDERRDWSVAKWLAEAQK